MRATPHIRTHYSSKPIFRRICICDLLSARSLSQWLTGFIALLAWPLCHNPETSTQSKSSMERLIELIERTNVCYTYMLISSWRSRSEKRKQQTTTGTCWGKKHSHSRWECKGQAIKEIQDLRRLPNIHTHTPTHAYSIGQVRVIDPNCDEIAPKKHFE